MLDAVKELLNEIGDVKDMYLVSCFFENSTWNIDFYSEAKHKIFTYTKVNGKFVVEEDDIFQVDKTPLEKLDIDKVCVDYDDAVQKISVDKERVIAILQVINGTIVWNLTVLTPALELYNLKIDAVTGNVLSEKKENIMNFRVSQ